MAVTPHGGQPRPTAAMWGDGPPRMADRKDDGTVAAVGDPHRVVVFEDGGVDWVALCETAGCQWVRVGFYRQQDAELSAAEHGTVEVGTSDAR